MRASWLFLSLIVHGAAVATALGVGAYAGQRLQSTPPRVELQTSLASAPAAPPIVRAPTVVVEAPLVEPVSGDPDVFWPFPEPPRREPAEPPPSPRATFAASLERIRPEPAPAPMVEKPAAEPAVEPAVEPTVEPAVEPAVEQLRAAAAPANVDAAPRADNEPPTYPEAERRQGHEGTVVVTAFVDARGDVVRVSLRSPCAHPGLNREAMRAVRSWRFEPARRAGVPVAGDTDVSIEFRLRQPVR